MNNLLPKHMTRGLTTAALMVAALSHGQKAFAQGEGITPFVSYVNARIELTTGQLVGGNEVFFGYTNSGPEVTIISDDINGFNVFLPVPSNFNIDRGQPTVFKTGTVPIAFIVTDFAGPSIWQIRPGVTATADIDSEVASISAYVRSGQYIHTDEKTRNDFSNLMVEQGGLLEMQSGVLDAGTLAVEDQGVVQVDDGWLRISSSVDVTSGGIFKMQGGFSLIYDLTLGSEGSMFINDGETQVQNDLLIADGGFLWLNSGELTARENLYVEGDFLQFAGGGGTLNVQGDFVVREGGIWQVVGDSTRFITQDVGDAFLNMGEIRLSNIVITGAVDNQFGSLTNIEGFVFFNDQVTGAGAFTGTGRAFFNGGYAPGASPAIVEHENSVFFGSSNTLEIELAGLALGEFDRLEILEDLDIDGELEVTLIDGFELGLNQQFEILDVTGTTTGQFNGLSEGDLVDNFGGIDLFISYTAGDGNDISLYTVPEPTSLALLSLGALGLLSRRRHAA